MKAIAIKEARNEAGITQAKLAELCGLATITIRQYESGAREPSFEKLIVIAKALDTTVSRLMGWESEDGWGDIGLTTLELSKIIGLSLEASEREGK